MIKCIVVIPFAYEPYFNECLATLKPLDNIVEVNNTKQNTGVANSWNFGIDRMKEVDADWLIILSATMRFGEPGGMDMIEQLEKHPEADLVHFAKKDFPEQKFERGKTAGVEAGMFSWYCTAISRRVIDLVGYFDPNFYPCYFEDIDYDLRVNKAISHPEWLVLPIDADYVSVSHAVNFAGIKSEPEKNMLYFAQKWGRVPHAPQLGEFDTPFNEPNNSLAFFPPAHGRLWNE